MKRKIILCSLLIAMCLMACGKKDNKVVKEKGSEVINQGNSKVIALISDYGNIDDKSFNEGTWNGVLDFAEIKGYEKTYYRALFDADEEREKACKQAIEEGSDILVCPGTRFSSVIYDIQQESKQQILLIDTEPKDIDGKVEINENVHCILYKEEEVGYLAGYAAVMEGYRKLGFLGGMDFAAVNRYGYGFVQGAEAAAKELKLAKNKVEIKFSYAGGFQPTTDLTRKVSKWYKDGTEVVFSCGGGIVYSVISAASEDGDRKIIGVDCDQSAESEQIIFSAMKGLEQSVKDALDKLHDNNGKWPETRAGKVANLGVSEDCVGLSATKNSWRMKNYSIKDYNKTYNKMKKGEIKISGDKLPKLQYVSLKKLK